VPRGDERIVEAQVRVWRRADDELLTGRQPSLSDDLPGSLDDHVGLHDPGVVDVPRERHRRGR
jgi:hypothetical protein